MLRSFLARLAPRQATRAALAVGVALVCIGAGNLGLRALAWPNLPEQAPRRYPMVARAAVPAPRRTRWRQR